MELAEASCAGILGLRDKPMLKTVGAVIDERGNVRLLEPVRPGGVRRALVIILEDRQRPAKRPADTALLSEAALAADWGRPEDEAWPASDTSRPR